MTNRATFLHSFEDDHEVTGERAFIDRFRISLGDWGLYGSEENACETLTNLRREEVHTPEGECIPLFSGDPIVSFKQRLNIKFASANNDNETADVSPLIAGRVAFSDRYRRPEKLKGARSTIQFNASLNLTRFIQAQKFKLKTPHIRPPRLLTPRCLAIDTDMSWFKDEVPLKKSTNLLIGPWTKYADALARPVRTHMSRYLGIVEGVLDRALRRSTRDGVTPPLRSKYYSLQEIEFYWEFDCDSPVQYVTSALPKIRSMSDRVFEGQVQIQDDARAVLITEAQSPSIKAKIAKGTWLRVYAKTTRRVRFEILLEASVIGSVAGGQTAATRNALCDKIGVLAEHSANKFNPVLALLQRPPAEPSTITAIRLLSEISHCAKDPYLAEAIVGALVSFDRIALYNNSPFRGAVHELRDRGVLVTVIPRSRNYTVSEKYRNAIEQLKRLLG
ncbi:hypothetical protein [Sulfitobacter geojensis]|uniref:hypothetical protein n=1 Tax=Sulfitobacter geojensis TaxID=1342299 RepID=UPI003B8EACAC